LPGFKHDTHATAALLLQSSPVVTHDELGLLSKYGLEFAIPRTNEMTMFSDGDTLVWYRDLDRTCEEIAKYSHKDAETYRKTVQFVQSVMPIMGMSMSRPPVSFGSFISLLEKAPFGSELIIAMMKSSYEVVTERFENPKVRIALLKRSMVSCCNPEERGTGLNILFVMAAVHAFPLAVVAGGMQGLTAATVRCLEDHGGELRVDSRVMHLVRSEGRVRSVEMVDGRVITARKAVIASIHPHDLGKMVSGLDEGLLERARRTSPSFFGTLMVHAALREKVRWRAGDVADQCGLVNLVDATDLDGFRRMYDAPRWGAISKTFSAGVLLPTNLDSKRAPPGRHILSSFSFVAFNLKDGGPGHWDEIKEEYADWVMERIANFAPNASGDNILGRAVESPLDLARYSPSFVAGCVNGIGPYLHQIMGMRPTPELAQYRVPGADGLYLAGPFMHPGGGITGGGRAVAMRVMDDLKVDYGKVIRN
jgi:phytoene dehydrogenase-like protein